MKLSHTFISLLLICALLISSVSFASFSVSADDDDKTEARYTQKIVAVVYDNSGSMGEGNRIPSAKYSLSMLMSLLDERDEMYIIPMNLSPSGGIEVDLAASNRSEILDSIIARSELDFKDGFGTPSNSMRTAVSILSDHGLKNADNLSDSDPDKEYWLIVLTDGLFENINDSSVQADYVANAIDNYPTLNTVYVSFGSGAIDISNETQLDRYQISTYCQVPENSTDGSDDLVSVMQKISNQISGRYPLNSDKYEVNGNTVTIDLSQIPFSLSSLSVIAQDCDATIVSADYSNGSADTDIALQKVCVIKPDSRLGIKSGCTFEVIGTSAYMYGGTLTLEFSNPVNYEQLSIFAEPALDISYYFEAEVDGNWQKVDLQYINSNLGEGDEIRVGYEVNEQVNGSVIDLESVFGDVNSKVDYNGTTYQMGGNIPLIVGSNELIVEVSVMDGAFTLRDFAIITVEENPTYFRVEAQGDTTVEGTDPKSTALFTVFVNNVPASKDTLSGYICTATATASDGTVIFEKEVNPNSDGKISVPFNIETNKFDVYTITLTVVSPQNLSRTGSHSVTYVPSSLTLNVNEEHLSFTQYDLKKNTDGFVFTLTVNEQPFPIVNGLTQYKLYVDDVDVTAFASVSNNTLTFIPNEENLKDIIETEGDKKIKLVITSSTHPNLDTISEATLTVIKTIYTIVPVQSDNNKIDRFDLENCNTKLHFTVERDGIPFTYEEMLDAFNNGKFAIEASGLFTSYFLPAGITTYVETIDEKPVLTVSACRDMNDYLDWHLSAFITDDDKPITVTYYGATATQSFTMKDSNIFQHILRIFMLIIVIIWLLHLIPFFISLFIAKPLPRGVIVYFSGSSTDFYEINVNIFKRILLLILWVGIRLLVPGLEFMNQKLWFQDPNLGDFELKFNRKDGLHFTPLDATTYFNTKVRTSRRLLTNQYLQNIIEGNYIPYIEHISADPHTFTLLSVFDKSNPTPLHGEAHYELTGGKYYGIYGEDRAQNLKLYQVITFCTF